MQNSEQLVQHFTHLVDIGVALSEETDSLTLLKKILDAAKALTHADGATLYLIKDKSLHFTVMQTTSIDLHSENNPWALAPIPLYTDDGIPNTTTMASCCAVSGLSTNIKNIRDVPEFDISGALKYDKITGYCTQSILTIPLINHEKDVIGVLQLINAQNPEANITDFSAQSQRMAEALAAQAAMSLTNQQLVKDMRELLEKFIEVIADAIDEKSPYTGGHCRRVPDIVMLFAEAIQSCTTGPFADQHFSPEEFYELKIAALLHDWGKITTPVHIVDKATKLETIFDRINLIESRFEILKRDIEIEQLKQQLAGNDKENNAEQCQQLDDDLAFLRRCNLGAEFMSEEHQQQIHRIARYQWTNSKGETQPLLNENEVANLTISKGTLTNDERQIINAHISTTIRMLESLPFPKHLRNVPEIASGHHERMDGKGYPKGLKQDEMSIQARMIGIADIFEALTATDRPYKNPMPLSQALRILANMSQSGHIDPELFQTFIDKGVYLKYAEQYMERSQIDEVNLSDLK